MSQCHLLGCRRAGGSIASLSDTSATMEGRSAACLAIARDAADRLSLQRRATALCDTLPATQPRGLVHCRQAASSACRRGGCRNTSRSLGSPEQARADRGLFAGCLSTGPSADRSVRVRGMLTTPTPKLSVVSPCYNEEGSLGELHRRLSDACRNEVGEDYEIVLVDDGSSDSTRSIISELCGRRSPHRRRVPVAQPRPPAGAVGGPARMLRPAHPDHRRGPARPSRTPHRHDEADGTRTRTSSTGSAASAAASLHSRSSPRSCSIGCSTASSTSRFPSIPATSGS